MSLLDSFLMLFETEGLDEISPAVKDANKELDNFEEKAQDAEDANKKLNQSLVQQIDSFKKLASQAAKSLAPFVLLGKAISDTAQFANEALEAAEAAQEAGMSLEEFQLQDGNRYALYTKEDVDNAKNYEMVMRDIRMGTKSITSNISRMLLPAMIWLGKVVRNVVDFFTEHGEFIKIMFIGLAVAITAFSIPAIIKMGVALWASLAPIIVPLGLIIALITGIALVIEDLIVWINGGESAFADLWDNIFGGVEGAKKLFNDLKQAFIDLWNTAKPILEGLVDIILKSVYYALRGLVTVIAAISNGIKAITGKNVDVNVNQKINGSHADGLDYVPYDGYIAKLHKGERVQTADEANDWRAGLLSAKRAISFTQQYPLNSIPQGSITTAYNNTSSQPTVNIGDITIQTQATDAQGIATDLAAYIKQAVISLDDGMLA